MKTFLQARATSIEMVVLLGLSTLGHKPIQRNRLLTTQREAVRKDGLEKFMHVAVLSELGLEKP